MGHYRLGPIPKTQKWTTIVAHIAAERDLTGPGIPDDAIKSIASATLEATQVGLERAVADSGLRYTFFLLTQIVLSARKRDWQEGLRKLGIHLSEEATLFDFTVSIQNTIDTYIAEQGHPTDISELAQKAIGEAIAVLAAPRATTLFGSGPDELQVALRALSTKSGFAHLGQMFFSRFLARFLNFYLSRITATHVGGDTLPQVGDLSLFNKLLEVHCEQSARVVRDFCGEWYSKTEFREGISLENTSRFMAVALKKLQDELMQQRAAR